MHKYLFMDIYYRYEKCCITMAADYYSAQGDLCQTNGYMFKTDENALKLGSNDDSYYCDSRCLNYHCNIYYRHNDTIR